MLMFQVIGYSLDTIRNCLETLWPSNDQALSGQVAVHPNMKVNDLSNCNNRFRLSQNLGASKAFVRHKICITLKEYTL